MREVFVLGAQRTAIGSFGGALREISAVELGGTVIREACRQAEVASRLQKIDHVLMGNVLQAGQGQNPARQAAIAAGIPVEIPAATLNKVCGSGLNAINLAAALIASGQADCVVAGGMENMSQAPHTVRTRWGKKMGDSVLHDSMLQDGLWDAFHDYHMGVTAENVAAQFGITRRDQDEFAAASQQKASLALHTGKFKDEITAVKIAQKKGQPILFDQDEYIREDVTVEKLGELLPAFRKNGTVTAGNSSGLNDGAAAIVLASTEFVKQNGLKPLAKWTCGASSGVMPAVMGIGPIPTIQKALGTANLQLVDIDLFEINEAFAAQAVAVQRVLKIQKERINVNGGAIALGHPIGASGARIAVTLLHEIWRTGGKYGLAALCIGGGMGEATIFERI